MNIKSIFIIVISTLLASPIVAFVIILTIIGLLSSILCVLLSTLSIFFDYIFKVCYCKIEQLSAFALKLKEKQEQGQKDQT